MFEKNESLRNLDFQCIIVTKLELRHSSKYLQTFTMITDNTTLCQCNCSSYSKYQSLPLSWAFTISAPPDKTSNLLHELFQSVTFHHDAPNSHVLDNFLEFLVYALSNKLS